MRGRESEYKQDYNLGYKEKFLELIKHRENMLTNNSGFDNYTTGGSNKDKAPAAGKTITNFSTNYTKGMRPSTYAPGGSELMDPSRSGITPYADGNQRITTGHGGPIFINNEYGAEFDGKKLMDKTAAQNMHKTYGGGGGVGNNSNFYQTNNTTRQDKDDGLDVNAFYRRDMGNTLSEIDGSKDLMMA